MARALFGQLSRRPHIGNAYLRQAREAAVTVSPQDLQREAVWRSVVNSAVVIARREEQQAAMIQREQRAAELGDSLAEAAAGTEIEAAPIDGEPLQHLGHRAVIGFMDEDHATILV